MRAADQILAYYNDCLARHGDSAPGAGWPNESDRLKRFDVMLGVAREPLEEVAFCDLGCGTGELLAYLKRTRRGHLDYTGIDRSAQALAIARQKHPEARFLDLDLLDETLDLSALECDYVIANGLFTVRADLAARDMRAFWEAMVGKMWRIARRGIAFNVMSTVVDWERADLFHVSLDDTAALLHRLAGRNVVFRADYGLYEYTAYAYREDRHRAPVGPPTASVPSPRPNPPTRVVEPRLPSARAIARYLPEIDASRRYSNFGPLAMAFIDQACERLALPPRCAVPTSSGTTALVAGILATAGRATPLRPLALVPAFTFVATALAAEQCGYRVRIADVDNQTWSLDPQGVPDRGDLAQIGLILPVAPLGRALPLQDWRAISEATTIPVVVDAAAAIEHYLDSDSAELGVVPTAFSLHATKSFSTGEGGLLVTRDAALALAAARAVNFGFAEDRICRSFGINGKLSEYQAAVGLAELDGWTEKRTQLQHLAEVYRACFAAMHIDEFLHVPPDVASCYALFRSFDSAQAELVRGALAESNIDTRFWYRPTVNQHPYFSRDGDQAVPVAEAIAGRLLGLPAGPALEADKIEQIALTIHRSLHAP